MCSRLRNQLLLNNARTSKTVAVTKPRAPTTGAAVLMFGARRCNVRRGCAVAFEVPTMTEFVSFCPPADHPTKCPARERMWGVLFRRTMLAGHTETSMIFLLHPPFHPPLMLDVWKHSF